MPKAVREALGWKPGAALDAKVNAEREVVLRLVEGTQFQRLRGMLAGSGRGVLQELLDEHTWEVERDEARLREHRIAENKAEYEAGNGPDIEELRRHFWREGPDPPGYDIDDRGRTFRVT